LRKHDLPPLPVRLLRVRGDEADVWLITNVLDEQRLPKRTAGKFYRWRWRNEGLFRSYKRTLGKLKLMARTVAQVHREAEGSLLATQLLVAQGALALPAAPGKVVLPSVRKVLLEIRAEIRNVTGQYLGPRQARSYFARLAQARWRDRQQRSSKVRRPWPGRQCGHRRMAEDDGQQIGSQMARRGARDDDDLDDDELDLDDELPDARDEAHRERLRKHAARKYAARGGVERLRKYGTADSGVRAGGSGALLQSPATDQDTTARWNAAKHWTRAAARKAFQEYKASCLAHGYKDPEQLYLVLTGQADAPRDFHTFSERDRQTVYEKATAGYDCTST
jgi:hypothetical protein